MTTDRQIAANRENAKKSTGPRTKNGKRRSRRNALRHGLTAETVIEVLENAADYAALAKGINADFRPATNFEHELMARLVSLLWRLRRATAIESGMLAIESKSMKPRASGSLAIFYGILNGSKPRDRHKTIADPSENTSLSEKSSSIDAEKVARSFLKVAAASGAAFDRLSRHEFNLWRQLVQTILLLNAINRGSSQDEAVIEYPRFGTMRKRRRILWPPLYPAT